MSKPLPPYMFPILKVAERYENNSKLEEFISLAKGGGRQGGINPNYLARTQVEKAIKDLNTAITQAKARAKEPIDKGNITKAEINVRNLKQALLQPASATKEWHRVVKDMKYYFNQLNLPNQKALWDFFKKLQDEIDMIGK